MKRFILFFHFNSFFFWFDIFSFSLFFFYNQGDDYLEAIRDTKKSSSNFLSVYEEDDEENNNNNNNKKKDTKQEKSKDDAENIKSQEQKTHHPPSKPSPSHVNTANQKDLRIFRISGLEWWTNEDEVSKIFNPHGRVFEIKFDEDKKNGKSNGIAYVYLDMIDTTPEELVEKLNKGFTDDKIRVDISSEEEIVKLKNYNKGRKERKEELAKLKQTQFSTEKSDQFKQSSYHSTSTSTTSVSGSSSSSTGTASHHHHHSEDHSYSSRKDYDKRRRDDYSDRYDRSYYYESSSRRDGDFDRKYRDSSRRSSRYDRGYRPY